MVEDSRNGMLAAVGADLTCVVTVSSYTGDEDFSEAALVVSSLGDPDGERTTVLAAHGIPSRTGYVDLGGSAGMSDGTERAREPSEQEVWMGEPSADRVELVVRTMAQTAVDNEKYFGDLDAVVGDGDFGYSMARGFEIVLADWDSFDRTDMGTFLRRSRW